ncbi:MAG: 3-hydroxyacyl-CoA dehydrogenase [Candidatus Nezhaarchaeales archaeon]|nr:MAG: 3-hydroxybutyryl-CoA dehydrogenase [Candidatus Nezhaarchaeota archaeon WYZ-LMO8]TDA37157.1 MAG: 3-hydroxybutyryl-CoA dehydrogenase [Candidatus Nezhaarchaeota archaeon WYZ-LMO7]
MSERIKKVAVIGAGVMGHGIAQVLATSGYQVALVDISQELLQKAIEKIKWSLSKFVEKKRLRPQDADDALARIKPTTSYEEAAKDIDLAIECVPENMNLKKKIFAELDRLSPPHAILSSNTSTLSITEMAKATNRPDKVAGLHFFNPPQMMLLVEVIKGQFTSDEVVNVLMDLCRKIGKTPILVKKDVRGFVVNRVLGAVFLEVFWTLARKEASIEAIDASVKYEGGFPMGWFELADFVGLDIVAATGQVMYEAYGERFKPCPEVIEPLVTSGKLGQKTGVGFYDWSKGRPRIPFNLAGEYDVDRSWAVAVNEAAWLVYDDVATPVDIDTGMKLGTGWPSGPCEYADKVGIDSMLNKLKALYEKYKMELYRPCPLLEDYIKKGWLGKKSGRGFYTYT